MLSSIGVNLPTSASGSQPSSNTKKDKIQQTPSSAKKNKLEAYPRNVRSSLQNKKSVVNTKDIASVQNSKFNTPAAQAHDQRSLSAHQFRQQISRSKDEAPDFIIKFLNMIQIRLKVGIFHETSVARSPQQNGVIERRNHTLIKAARTMLIYAQAPLFLWVEAVATVCYTQRRSIIRLRHGKTPYKL
nr:putative ribonuclease H-like domain-containing protein [Tanacetum cinerariifolium]